MEKKLLYMIGNSHIDPVWFWNWEEGMQEVKATYASALERMKEFDDFKFTSTSTAFFEWIEHLLPEMFEEIKKRVAEGRWEITGGWFIEPDCALPCGESFVRQSLYGQRYLKSRFGKICKIGSNVDSFGHNHVLPQILKKSGMDAYVFMRPRLDTPVFRWESEDGSQVNAISLPAEYTTWFHDPTVKNIQNTLERTKGYDRMVCCYGVGNHGGGPTIENIRSILKLQEEWEDTELRFSSYTEFLADSDFAQFPVIKGVFEKVNEGCYSIDSAFKQRHRLAEQRLMDADRLMSMVRGVHGLMMRQTEEIERLWKVVLFNEFHDTLGGTTIPSAREEGLMQLGGVCARAGEIKALAIQQLVNGFDTRGEGFPLYLFHTGSTAWEDYVEVELEWFCQSPLKLLDLDGTEIPYQRIHTDAKVRHTTLGGRRRFVFRASIPPYGFVQYRVVKEEPSLAVNPQMEIQNRDCSKLENPYLLARFDTETGALCSLVDKQTGYDALQGASSWRLYLDERDAWGGLQGRRYEDRNADFRLESIEKVESGTIREVIRVRLSCEDTRIEQLYYLGAEEKELRVENRVCFNHRWSLLKLAYPTGSEAVHTRAESAYGTLYRKIEDTAEYYMHRFLDASDASGRGLAIANDSKYAFNMTDGRVQITAARSAIYAQGSSPDWYNEAETYQYTDIGPQTFWLVLKPHGAALAAHELYDLADKINGGPEYLADSAHPAAGGAEVSDERSGTPLHEEAPEQRRCSLLHAEAPNVRVMMVKKAEDDDGYILRLLETDGEDTRTGLGFLGKRQSIQIGHHEIATYHVSSDGASWEKVNLIEWKEEEQDR